MKRVLIRMADELAARLTRQAQADHRSVNQQIVVAIERMLDRPGRPQKDRTTMKLTNEDILANAQDWIGASQDLTSDEVIDREQLSRQLGDIVDDEDVEAIAQQIERICKERFA
jgi:hypothetical protein